MGLCLFANKNVINHAETRMIDQNKKPTAVYLAGTMRKGKNEVDLLKFCKNVKFCNLCLNCNIALWLLLWPHCI